MRTMRITPTRDRLAARWSPVAVVAGRSMEPTLPPGAIVLARPRPAVVRRGQVVLLRRPDGQLQVKRVVAVGGDVVEMEAARLRVNGTALDGRAQLPGATVTRWEVPSAHYFVVGDNPGGSADSRVWADPFVRHDSIAGVVRRSSTRRTAPGHGW